MPRWFDMTKKYCCVFFNNNFIVLADIFAMMIWVVLLSVFVLTGQIQQSQAYSLCELMYGGLWNACKYACTAETTCPCQCGSVVPVEL